MKITQINLDDEGVPSDVTVKLSLDQAALIARVFGSYCGNSYKSTGDMSRWSVAGSDLYSGLVSDLFNRFWDDGVNDVLRNGPAVIEED